MGQIDLIHAQGCQSDPPKYHLRLFTRERSKVILRPGGEAVVAWLVHNGTLAADYSR